MSTDKPSSMRAFPNTKARYDEERKGRESDDKLLNRLLDELQALRKMKKE